ncbi:hypothetical protein ACA910_012887 [Epithemia clementina (nom. ined.)]
MSAKPNTSNERGSDTTLGGKEMASVGAAMVSLAARPMLRNENPSASEKPPPPTREQNKQHQRLETFDFLDEKKAAVPDPSTIGGESIVGDSSGDSSNESDDDNDDDYGDGEDADDAPSWTSDAHRAFVEAVFHVGIRQASPSVILELMRNEDNQPLTTERVKSRLQKYRNNLRRSHSEFMQEYDTWITKALTVGRAGGGTNYADPSAIVEMMGIDQLMGGDVAAYLTYSCIAEDSKLAESKNNKPETDRQDLNEQEPSLATTGENGEGLTPQQLWNGSQDYAKYFTGSTIKLPTLTEAERASPLGVSMSHVVSLFYSMTQQVMKLRTTKEKSSIERELKEQHEREELQQQEQQTRKRQENEELQLEQEQQQTKKRHKQPPPEHAFSPTIAEEPVSHQNSSHAAALPAQEQAAQALYTMADLATGQAMSQVQGSSGPAAAAASANHHPFIVAAPGLGGLATRGLRLEDYHFLRRQLPQSLHGESIALPPSLANHYVNLNGSTHFATSLPLQSPPSLPPGTAGSFSISSLPALGALQQAAPGQQCIVYVPVPESSLVSRQS